MLEAQLSPFSEKYDIDAETDDNGSMNPILSGANICPKQRKMLDNSK